MSILTITRWHLPGPPLRRSILGANGVGVGAIIVAGALVDRGLAALGEGFLVRALALFEIGWLVAVGYLDTHHPFTRFGVANQVTMVRLALVTLLSSLLFEPATPSLAATAGVTGLVALALDGVDGWLARRTRMTSEFGARFDMEVDTLLILALAILTWLHGKAGAWILAAGALRYLFVAGGWLLPGLRAPLPERARRKFACVVQIGALAFAVMPILPEPQSAFLAGGALALLTGSFAIDVVWLWSRASGWRGWPSRGRRRDGALILALFLLNTSLTFENVWPTPGVHFGGTLSLELAIAVLLLAAAESRRIRPSRSALRVVAGMWLLLVVGRYGDVTAPALYGRDVNLYWDLPHVTNVGAMLAMAAPSWLVALVIVSTIAAVAVLFIALLRAWGWLAEGMTRQPERRLLTVAASGIAIAFLVAPTRENPPGRVGFSAPVTASYARHVRLALTTLAARGENALISSPRLDPNLERVSGADVMLIFIESYGAAAWERPEYAAPLNQDRVELEAAVTDTDRSVVSAYVESPTFGGVSWLAHISLMSGLEVRDPERNAQVMAQSLDTLPTAFSRRGYRTVAVMPGLWQSWPEGVFYGFDEIYGGEQLGYRGPPFGWWSIPDQFAIARLDELELAPSPRRPVFAFFPTVSTHAPFSPTPPYQPDWTRILTDHPFDADELDRAYEQWADWMNLGPGYVSAVSYTYQSLTGYLRVYPERDLVMVLIGDHQPPAAVSGEGAPWDVPVHVITNRPPIVEHLLERGFTIGLTPRRPTLGPMHALLPVLLDAFSESMSIAETTRFATP